MDFIAITIDSARERLATLLRTTKVDTSDGLCGVDDVVGDGRAFEAHRDGQPMALIVIQKVERAHGRELEVRAAVALGSGGLKATEAVLPAIEAAFGWDCDVMTIYTRRGGLVRKLERAGYREAAKIMRKEIAK